MSFAINYMPFFFEGSLLPPGERPPVFLNYSPFFFNYTAPPKPLVASACNTFDRSGGCAEILVGEEETFALDFTDKLAAGDSLDASDAFSWVASVCVGTDPTPDNTLDGDCQLIGTQVLQRLTGAIVGNTYTMVATAETANGDTLKMWLNLKIVAPGCTAC